MEELATGGGEDWIDITIGNYDNAGALDVRGCNTEGCRIDFVDFDGDGVDELVTNNGSLTVEGWGTTVTLQHQGIHRIDDIDGDGTEELLIQNAEGLWVYRGFSGGMLPPFGLGINTDTVLPAQFVDINDNGVLSPVVLRENGKLAHPKQ
jgi:hypothetical protein